MESSAALPHRIAVLGLGSALLLALVLLGATMARSRVAPASPPSFTTLYRGDASGVVRIDATTCAGSGVGSGFLLGPHLVATVAHVVAGATAIDLTAGNRSSSGHLVGLDPSSDVALIRTSSPLPGHVFGLASSIPPVGTSVGVIGYPEGGPLSFSQGTVSGLSRTIEVAGQTHTDMIQTDAPIDPGSSGGPLVDLEGRVVGLVDAFNSRAADIGYAVPASIAQPPLLSWSRSPLATAPAACAVGSRTQPSVRGSSGAPESIGIASTLTTYFNAIDDGDYRAAYAQFTPEGQALIGSEQRFALGEATSYDSGIGLNQVSVEGPGMALADVTFRSVQAAASGPGGDTCDSWTLVYTMVDVDGSWLIQQASGIDGTTHTTC